VTSRYLDDLTCHPTRLFTGGQHHCVRQCLQASGVGSRNNRYTGLTNGFSKNSTAMRRRWPYTGQASRVVGPPLVNTTALPVIYVRRNNTATSCDPRPLAT
jgi:hypothetical protein